MGQLLIAIGVTITLVIFSMSNSHDVELDCIVGPPVQIRLIVLLAVAFFGGAMAAYFYQMTLRVVRNSAARRGRRQFDIELDEEEEF
jgi:uncharacterized integral membrane protein